MLMLCKNADECLELYMQMANGCRTVYDAQLMPPLLQKILFGVDLFLKHFGELSLARSLIM